MDNVEKFDISHAALAYTANILKDLHARFVPHDGQIPIGKALFYDNKKFVFLECGRKFGKSELLIYCLYRYALSRPSSACYYIAPFMKQAKELIWANNRLQNFLYRGTDSSLVQKYIASVNNTEMRITFFNGSFIKLDGADNYEAYRGINPHCIAYDEFKDHNPKFHEGMEPNLATFQAPCIFVGTPPENEHNHFIRIADSIREDMEDGAYFCMPTHMNPHIDKKWLEKTKQRLIARGELDVYLREYEAKRVKGGRNAIFPMFDRHQHVVRYDMVVAEIKKAYKDYSFYCTFDPASASVFAVLITAVHKYTRKVYHLDCVYATNTKEMSTRPIWDTAKRKLREIMPVFDKWAFTHDEAAAWFANELRDITEEQGDDVVNSMPTHKSMSKKDAGLSLIKDQMLFGYWYCTDRCEKLIFEIENCVRDDKLKIAKENDHLLDCIAEGSLVSTSIGYVKIESILKGDYVLTREGYKVVTGWKFVGQRYVIQIGWLECTPEHKVWCCNKKEFTSADSLRYYDALLYQGDYLWQRLLKSTVLNLEDTLTQKEETIEFITKQTLIILSMVYVICMCICGKNQQEKKSKMDFAYTIKTVIQLTMSLVILSVYHLLGICLNILLNTTKKIWINLKITWTELDILQASGTVAKKEKNGIRCMQRKLLLIGKWLSIPANYVEKCLNLSVTGFRHFAQTLVKQKIEECRGLIILLRNVRFVGEILFPVGILQKKRVLKNVFDLSVDGMPEFYANGVLVHNCMRYTNSSDNYTRIPSEEPKEKESTARYYTIRDDLINDSGDNWEHAMLQETYHDYYSYEGVDL